jgi:hypothetical protein
MTPEEASEYTQSLSQIHEGGWRQLAWAIQQKIPKVLGLSDDDWVASIGGAVRLRAIELREAAAQLDKEGMGLREIGAALGVSKNTVSRSLSPVPNGTDDLEEPEDPQASDRHLDEPVPNGTDDLEEPEDPQASAPEPAPTSSQEASPSVLDQAPMPPDTPMAHVLRNTGENEWYTPVEYIRSAITVMGAIDLDPASSEEANKVVGAEEFYTLDDDGLAQPWSGRIWMNPPYERGMVDKFCGRLTAEHVAGLVPEACALVNNSTDSSWFQVLLSAAAAVCFPLYRIRFWNPDPAKESNPLQGQAVLYLGERVEEFQQEFSQYGGVVRVLRRKTVAQTGSSAVA